MGLLFKSQRQVPTQIILEKPPWGEISGVARAFPGGRLAHPESQNEEENEKRLRKYKKK